MNQQQQAQYQQQLKCQQQLQAREQPQQSQPDTASNLLTDIAKGTWKALTEGGAAAVEAGGKAWDEREKIKDGAELGFKMAGPVVWHAAKEAGWDGLVAGASLSKYPQLKIIADALGTTDYQLAMLLKNSQSDAQDITARIERIVEDHSKKKR